MGSVQALDLAIRIGGVELKPAFGDAPQPARGDEGQVEVRGFAGDRHARAVSGHRALGRHLRVSRQAVDLQTGGVAQGVVGADRRPAAVQVQLDQIGRDRIERRLARGL